MPLTGEKKWTILVDRTIGLVPVAVEMLPILQVGFWQRVLVFSRILSQVARRFASQRGSGDSTCRSM